MNTRFFVRFSVTGSATALLFGLLAAVPAAEAAPRAEPGIAAVRLPAADPASHRESQSTAEGSLTVQMDPSTLQAVPITDASRCRLTVKVTLAVVGPVQGSATGTTVALINAPCAEATSRPPGTFADLFRFSGTLHGDVSGVPGTAAIVYTGMTRPGGQVSGLLILHGDATALAAVRAHAGTGGTYRVIAWTNHSDRPPDKAKTVSAQ